MKFDEWVARNLGKGLDPDGVYGIQCVDLIKSYCIDVIELNKSPKDQWGNAIDFYIGFNNRPWLVSNFDKIPNTPDFIPQKGDIGVFKSLGKYGHIVVCNGVGDTHSFQAYDQNYNGTHAGMTLRTFRYNGTRKLLGVLRPKNRANIDVVENHKRWQYWKNGKTKEKIYADIKRTSKIGTMFKYEQGWCYFQWLGSSAVVYNISGGHYKVGFAKYNGGVVNQRGIYRGWKNGKTREIVYADTTCKEQIGSINPHEAAWCYGEFDGVYLVLYSIGNNNYKVGFVEYKG